MPKDIPKDIPKPSHMCLHMYVYMSRTWMKVREKAASREHAYVCVYGRLLEAGEGEGDGASATHYAKVLFEGGWRSEN